MVRIFSKVLIPGLIIGALIASCGEGAGPKTITGTVINRTGAVAGATVRVKTTDSFDITDEDGKFTLVALNSTGPVMVTAWASGYYIAGIDEVLPGDQGIEIVLTEHHDTDNPDYTWLPSLYHPGQGEDQGCAECHSSQNNPKLDFSLPVDEWLGDAHSQSALNPRFLSMYLGQDVNGNQSPQVRYGVTRDYGAIPLRPDPAQPYFGPGYKLDFPDTAGNCAACHTPAASVNDPYGVDPTAVEGVPAEGVPCDFCHKVWDVRLDPVSGLPYANMPGSLSFEFRRPPDGHQFFAGPLDDVAPGEDTYSPLQQQSQFCAPCHFGEFWGTTIYNSFGEWLESPYSDPETGQTCQDCHMPPLGNTHFALPAAGGEARNPDSIFSHRMPGASDEELLQNAVTMSVTTQRDGEQIRVEVTLLNDQTGHHIPTDSPLRQLILLVNAQGQTGKSLKQLAGPTVPEWGGVGNPVDGYFAGLPGKGYAKILMELWTEVSPTGAYWNPTRVLSDNRLAAFEADTNTYNFSAPPNGKSTVNVTLLFRRAYIELMDQKGWDAPDIVIDTNTISIP